MHSPDDEEDDVIQLYFLRFFVAASIAGSFFGHISCMMS